MKIDPSELQKLVSAVLAAIQRDGRLPTRLNTEDFDDLRQEGILGALGAVDNFDPARGSMGAYLRTPITRSILRAAWSIANCGLTGDVSAVQVWSLSDNDDDHDNESYNGLSSELPYVPDIADEIEAFDTIWHRFYIKTE